jgi:hypothetical protein
VPTVEPPEDLVLGPGEGVLIRVRDCHLVAHNAALDGKADPLDFDDPCFHFLYRSGSGDWFLVSGLNPEMMSARPVNDEQARAYRERLPFGGEDCRHDA